MPIIQNSIEITALTGGSTTIYSDDNTFDYLITGTAILVGNWSIVGGGTWTDDMICRFRYEATVTLGAFRISIFGTQIPIGYEQKEWEATARYSTGLVGWVVSIRPDFEETNIITQSHLVDNCVGSSELIAAGVTYVKIQDVSARSILANDTLVAATVKEVTLATNSILVGNAAGLAQLAINDESLIGRTAGGIIANIPVAASQIVGRTAAGNLGALTGANVLTILPLTDTYLYIGNATNYPQARQVTGVIAITNTGVTSFAAGAIVNNDINNAAAIAFTKLAAITQGRVLTNRGAGNVEYNLSTNAFMVVGDGTDFNSVAITGAIAVTNAGVTSINNYQVTEQLYGYIPAAAGYDLNGGAIGYTIPAATVGADTYYVKVIAWGTTAANANAKAITVTFDGNAIATNTTTTNPFALDWIIESEVVRISNTTWKSVARITFDAIADEIDISSGAAINWTTAAYTVNISTTAVALDVILQGFEVVLVRS